MKHLIIFATLATLLLPISSAGATSPQLQTTGHTKLDKLFARLANVANEALADNIEKEIWQSWMAQPNVAIRHLMTQAMEARRWYDFNKAHELLTRVIEMSPDYAEGWNQRAFILFLQEKYDKSLSDLERALQLEPRHFGAMAGQARILMRQGRFATGQKILKNAVKIHPYLKERSMIVDSGEREI